MSSLPQTVSCQLKGPNRPVREQHLVKIFAQEAEDRDDKSDASSVISDPIDRESNQARNSMQPNSAESLEANFLEARMEVEESKVGSVVSLSLIKEGSDESDSWHE